MAEAQHIAPPPGLTAQAPAPQAPAQQPQPTPTPPQVPSGNPWKSQEPTTQQDQGNPNDPAKALAEILAKAMQPVAPAAPQVPAAPQAPKAPGQEPQRPAGGLNDLDLGEVENPQIRAVGKLALSIKPDLDIERAVGNALRLQDASLIDTAYLREAGGAQADVLIQAAQSIVELSGAESQANIEQVYSLAGGQANWDAAVAAFNQTASAAMKRVVVGMIDSPKRADILEGARFIMSFAQDSGATVQNAELVQVGAGGRGDPGVRGLDKASFQKALTSLDPNDAEYASKRQDLIRLRYIGRQRGL